MVLTVPQEVLAGVSTFHNCATHGCSVTRTRPSLQERELTNYLEDEVKHAVHPDDRVLNLAQLRNAVVLQLFRRSDRYPDQTPGAAVKQALVNRQRREHIALQKKKDEEQKRKDKASAALRKKAQAEKR